MYSESVINQTLYEFKKVYGWMPEEHSIDEVDRFIAHVNSIVDIESNSKSSTITPKRDFTARENQFIRNEAVMCWASASYFKTRYCMLSDASNNLIRYKPRKAQQAFNLVISDLEALRVAIEIILLKARQMGISTEVALDFIHRLLFVPGTQAIMAAVKDETSELLHRIATTCLANLPWWLTPGRKRNKIGQLLEYNTGSILSIQSGTQRTGIAQGWTPTLVHISEAGDYPNPKVTIETGLMRATHPSAALFAVYEGTGNGNTGWWADSWRTAKELHPRGRSRLLPLFLSWPMAPDLYPLPDWVKKFPVPYEFRPSKETRAHVAKCEAYIHNTPLIAKIMGEDWKMPIEQQWFWQFNFEEARSKHMEKIWCQQMPADDFEALTGKNDMVFGSEQIEIITRERERKYQAYAVTGTGIDPSLSPDDSEIDYEKERIEIDWTARTNGDHFQWTLIPLHPIDESDERSAMGKLLVFEEPVPGEDYSMGGDTSDGLGQDRAILNMTKYGKDAGFDTQVAEFASDILNSIQLVPYAACLLAWYGNETTDSRGCKCIFEQRRKPGDDCQLQLKRMGFIYHHKFIYYDGTKIVENKSHKEGWFTNTWSRPLLLGRYKDAVDNGWLKINSPFLIAESADFERKLTVSGTSKMEHQSGKKDDRIFAQAMAYFTRHALDVMLARSKKRYNLPTEKPPELVMGWHEGISISIGSL